MAEHGAQGASSVQEASVRNVRSSLLTLWAILLAAATLGILSLPLPAGADPQFQVIATVDVGVNPFGDQVAPDGGTVWVANAGTPGGTQGHTVTVLDTTTFATQSVIGVGNFPEDIAFASAGSQAFVTNSSDATVSVVDTSTRTVGQTVDLSAVPMLFPFGVIATNDSQKVFVTSVGTQRDTSLDNIAVLDNSNQSNVVVGAAISVPGATGRPALTPDGSLLVVPRGRGDLAPPEALLIDPASNQIVADLTLGRAGATQSATVTPDGRFAYVSILGGTGGVWVIDLATRSTVMVIPTPDTRIFGVQATPDGRFVLATDFLLGEVSVISTATNQIIANVPVGSLPNDIAVTPDSAKAFVTNQGSTTVSVISISST
jgi:YVTN family beta-propeller protein